MPSHISWDGGLLPNIVAVQLPRALGLDWRTSPTSWQLQPQPCSPLSTLVAKVGVRGALQGDGKEGGQETGM